MKIVSVIIPIYQSENFIWKCVNSVRNQSLKNIEIILVDDGSSDNSPQICDELAEQDERIVVIHKQNGGVSSARNVVMRAATGSFVTFVDIDDWIESYALEKMYETIKKTSTDICICTSYFRNDTVVDTLVNKQFEEKLNPNDALKKLFSLSFGTSLWMCLYKRERLNIFLNEGLYYFEDFEFQFRFLQEVENVSIYREPLYHYRINSEGITQQGLNDKIMSCLKIPELIKNYLNSNIPLLQQDLMILNCRFVITVALCGVRNAYVNKQYKKIIKQKAKQCRRTAFSARGLEKKLTAYIYLLSISPTLFFKCYRLMKGIR